MFSWYSFFNVASAFCMKFQLTLFVIWSIGDYRVFCIFIIVVSFLRVFLPMDAFFAFQMTFKSFLDSSALHNMYMLRVNIIFFCCHVDQTNMLILRRSPYTLLVVTNPLCLLPSSKFTALQFVIAILLTEQIFQIRHDLLLTSPQYGGRCVTTIFISDKN